jgi:Protein of unknown function (DUF2950)
MKTIRVDDFNRERVQIMKTAKSMNLNAGRTGLLLVLLGLLFTAAAARAGSAAASTDVKQRLFTAPEEAIKALTEAAKAKDQAALAAVFGSDYETLLSGDEIQDNRELERFAAAIDKSAKLEKAGDEKFTLTIGENNWPFPIPVVKQGEQWRFDTKAGMEEILNRRIGENELSAIATCRAYVLAQWEYFTEGDHDNDSVAEYAQHFISTPGQRDGLYWDTAEGEKPSPMGALVAAARAEGYSAGRGRQTRAAGDQAAPHRHPYNGYYFKILKSQGPHAPGGKYGYVINGNMIAGYALIAYPDKWGSSGVMTFIVNQQGRVYEKNLGPNTLKVAGAITEYNPDPSWKLVKE